MYREHIMNLPTAFASVLKSLRLENSLSQQQLADKCELNRTFISMLERGIKQPSLTTIFVLAKHLSVAPHELVIRVETKTRRVRWFRNHHG